MRTHEVAIILRTKFYQRKGRQHFFSTIQPWDFNLINGINNKFCPVEHALNLKQKKIGCYHNTHTTIVPMNISSPASGYCKLQGSQLSKSVADLFLLVCIHRRFQHYKC